MSLPFSIPVLEGALVRLEPLSERHGADLAAAAEEDRSAYDFTLVPRGAEVGAFLRSHRERAEKGTFALFAQIRLSDGRVVGCTAYWDLRTWPGRSELRAVEIGSTWLAMSAQGTGINVESKLLLLTYAFEELGVARVDLKTDARNERSRRAIEGLGASFEGVLRRRSTSWASGEEGQLRDSAMYSVIASEWTACEDHLRRRLGHFEAGANG